MGVDGEPSIKQNTGAREALMHLQHNYNVIPKTNNPRRPQPPSLGQLIGYHDQATPATSTINKVIPYVCNHSKHLNTLLLTFRSGNVALAAPTSVSATVSKDTISCLNLSLQVQTSDIKGAGTDAGIEINLFGANGDTGYHPLMANYDTFERGQVCVCKHEINFHLRLGCSASKYVPEISASSTNLW